MNILSAFIVFDILIIVYELIIEVCSAIYELSGLTKEQARFQITSLLTGTGFTTTESEKMLESPKRKRTTRNIMIVSYIFNISIISTLVTLLTSTKTLRLTDLVVGLLISIVIIILLFFSRRISKIRKFIDRVMLYTVGRILYNKQNEMIIYEYYGKKALTEVRLNKVPKGLKGKTLEQLNLLEKNGINLLYIKRNREIITAWKETKLYEGDVILMLGDKKNISELINN